MRQPYYIDSIGIVSPESVLRWCLNRLYLRMPWHIDCIAMLSLMYGAHNADCQCVCPRMVFKMTRKAFLTLTALIYYLSSMHPQMAFKNTFMIISCHIDCICMVSLLYVFAYVL